MQETRFALLQVDAAADNLFAGGRQQVAAAHGGSHGLATNVMCS